MKTNDLIKEYNAKIYEAIHGQGKLTTQSVKDVLKDFASALLKPSDKQEKNNEEEKNVKCDNWNNCPALKDSCCYSLNSNRYGCFNPPTDHNVDVNKAERNCKTCGDSGLYCVYIPNGQGGCKVWFKSKAESKPEVKEVIGGFAEGNYSCKCINCGDIFQGNKRAVQCKPCALKVSAKDKEVKLSSIHSTLVDLKCGDTDVEKALSDITQIIDSFHPKGTQVITIKIKLWNT